MPVNQQDTITLRGLVDVLENLGDDEEDSELQMIELKEGEILFEQGEKADSMYVLIAGVLGVRVTHGDGTETIIDRLAPGAILGEMAQMSGGNRTATVYAVNDAGVIKLSNQKLEELSNSSDQITQLLDDASAPRWQRLLIVKTLKHLFGDLDTSALHSLQNHLEWQHHSNGSIVFNEGDPPDGLFIVVNGRLRVMLSDSNGRQSLHSEVGPGETVGEFGVLTGDARTATICAVRETDLIKISRDELNRLMIKFPQLLGNITRIIVERQQRAIKGIHLAAPAAQTIGLLPADAAIDLQEFSTQLSSALTDQGSVMILDSQKFSEIFGESARSENGSINGGSIGIKTWLGEMEARNDFVIFSMDTQPSAWSRLCIGQADRILIVANPGSDPSPGEIENLLSNLEIPIRTELVLWHSENTVKPSGTATWFAGRNLQAHHHVRKNDMDHMRRLARRLSGHAVGLVLSGGGARGFSHLGVYQAMNELGIPIDYVGGSSFGALMAGLIAQHLSRSELMKLAEKFATPGKIFDYTLPFIALMTSKKVTDICREIFGEMRIEDLWCPFFCVSTNLSLAKPTLHQSGYLWQAIRSSLSIPGIFAPVISEQGVLVDGGVMDNFPVEWMNKLCESDRIVGVHASPHQDKIRQWDYANEISGWKVLARKINPFAKPIRSPSLISTVLRSQEINSAFQSKKAASYIDLLIEMDVRQFGFLDFASYPEIAQAGYENSLSILKNWHETYPHYSNE